MVEPIRKPRGPLTWLAARTWRFWVMVPIAAVLPLMYVASFGPYCALHDGAYLPAAELPDGWGEPLDAFYSPVIWAANDAPVPVQTIVLWYISLWY